MPESGLFLGWRRSECRGLGSGRDGIEDRQRAYACDITYATANEVGFDFLRDQLSLHPREQVHRPFAVAAIDEADSILIDEARIPLVIAGGKPDENLLAYHVDGLARQFQRGLHYTLDEYGRNIALTDAGIHAVESAFACGNLFVVDNLRLPDRCSGLVARARFASARRRLPSERRRGRICR